MTKLTSRVGRIVASFGAGLVLAASVGVASAHNGGNYGGHDKGKGNKVEVTNNNGVGVTNTTTQTAVSGEAKTDPGNDKNKCQGGGGNWFSDKHKDCDSADPAVAGDASTGDASNDNTSDLSVDIDNSGICSCLQGADTDGHGGSSVKITNNNGVGVTNTTTQTAVSGNATVKGSGGNASTGNASNSNDTTISVKISN